MAFVGSIYLYSGFEARKASLYALPENLKVI
jgi:hypothetical protein